MIPESLIPWLIVIAGVVGFYIVFKILKKTISIALIILIIALAAAAVYVLL